ncbi:MAG TPA: archaellin/type IV pilin N-terminal domain-containing protein, partial [Thermoplasmata archaeon]|nr:archaellin/type IV pilin N-terminal domain-containing protein [Thermoplasmata archaeon]
MNVLAAKERSWRKARKRAVSPIIATILLVAITVVLAAVLYVLITG